MAGYILTVYNNKAIRLKLLSKSLRLFDTQQGRLRETCVYKKNSEEDEDIERNSSRVVWLFAEFDWDLYISVCVCACGTMVDVYNNECEGKKRGRVLEA